MKYDIETLSKRKITEDWFIFLIDFIDSKSSEMLKNYSHILRIEKIHPWLYRISVVSDCCCSMLKMKSFLEEFDLKYDLSTIDFFDGDKIQEDILPCVLHEWYLQKDKKLIIKRRKRICRELLEKKFVGKKIDSLTVKKIKL